MAEKNENVFYATEQTSATDAPESQMNKPSIKLVDAPTSGGMPTVPNPSDAAIVPVPISVERLHELEAIVQTNIKESMDKSEVAFNALMTIKEEEQYKAENYTSFEAYCKERWPYSRVWLDQMCVRKRLCQLIADRFQCTIDEAYKKLGLHDANVMRTLEHEPDVFLAALKEAQERADQKTGKNKGKIGDKLAKEVTEKWKGFVADKDNYNLTPPLTIEEWSLLAQLRRNKHDQRGTDLVKKAKEKATQENLPLALALDEICKEAEVMPKNEELLQEARGEALA